MTTVNKSDKDRVIIFDTTCARRAMSRRHMSFEEKLEIAEMLDDMGVDVIEAGFPITSKAISRRSARSPGAPRMP